MRTPTTWVARLILPVAAGIGAASVAGLLAASPAAARPETRTNASSQALARAAYARMTPAQRIGQLFMAGVPSDGSSSADRSLLRTYSVGNVILDFDTTKSRVAIRRVTKQLTPAVREAGVAAFISTDQEGGDVQRLTGHGFASIPTALAQGRLHVRALRVASAAWGDQLLAAGVNLDLAPVADTVPAGRATSNQPIGRFDREYGHSPRRVASHADAFLRGMHDAAVATTVKHFPGLGRATGNTDTSPHVTDPTTRHDPYLRPFRDGITAGTQFVMVSSARYPRIDGHRPACFSATIIGHLLRHALHFEGVVISDDLGTSAMARVAIPRRAIKFFSAGGTMVLNTTIGQLPAMIRAVAAKRATSPVFARRLHAAEMTVLVEKARASLVNP
jgi:beta-N-acetylhexosaminidase